MTDSPSRYLIAYDIRDDKRRTKIHNYLNAFGVRAQFSVFLVDLRSSRMTRLKDQLTTMIDPSEDSILVCKIGPTSQIERRTFEYLGMSRPTPPAGPIVF